MGLTAKSNGGEGFKSDPIEQGIHTGVCCAIIDLGIQEGFQGKRTHKCILTWELPDVRLEIEEDGEKKNVSRMCSQEFTLSLHEKSKLHSVLVQWRGKPFTQDELDGFEMKNILGAPCQIQIIHQPSKKDPSKVYGNVASVLPAPKGIKVNGEIEPLFFSFEDCEPGVLPTLPDTIPGWIQDKIKEGFTWKEWMNQPEPQNQVDPTEHPDVEVPDEDSIPF